MATVHNRDLIVGDWLVQPDLHQVSRRDVQVHLEPKLIQLILVLADHAGQVVPREELISTVWPETFVTDQVLTHAIWQIRQAFGGKEAIQTIPKRGYRLTLPVVPVDRPPSKGALKEFTGGMVAAEQAPFKRKWTSRRVLAVSATVVLVVVLLLLLPGGLGHYVTTRTASRRVMLAVLPLENLSGDPEQQFLADSLTEEIITELGRLNPNRLGVIARSSVTQFQSTKKTISEIGKELRVDYVLEGGARRADHRLRVNLQLIRVSDQTHAWAESYDSELGDILTVERTVAENTARTLSFELLPGAQQRLASRRAVSDEAQEAYMRGRFLLGRRTAEAFKQAESYFERAIELEPRYAEAYAGQAFALMILPNYQGLTAGEAIPKAKAAALKALEIDPALAEARTVLAQIHSEFEWDFAGAEREFKQVLEDNPNFAPAHSGYAVHLWAMGRFDDGNAEMKKTAELAPLSLGTGVDLGRGYYFARQYDRAIAQYERVIELDPNFSAAHSMLGMALLEKHEYDRAIAELQKGIALSGGQSVFLPYAYAVAGRKKEAQQELTGCLERWKIKHTGGGCMALAYSGLGDKDQAFAWLENEFQEHTGIIFMLKAYPYWDSLRSDPRYRDLLRRAGLPQ